MLLANPIQVAKVTKYELPVSADGISVIKLTTRVRLIVPFKEFDEKATGKVKPS